MKCILATWEVTSNKYLEIGNLIWFHNASLRPYNGMVNGKNVILLRHLVLFMCTRNLQQLQELLQKQTKNTQNYKLIHLNSYSLNVPAYLTLNMWSPSYQATMNSNTFRDNKGLLGHLTVEVFYYEQCCSLPRVPSVRGDRWNVIYVAPKFFTCISHRLIVGLLRFSVSNVGWKNCQDKAGGAEVAIGVE